ncbi:hypothetical protein [Sphingobacterium anhuiense]|uniref:Uncharacterized protein n=1 Tax=Sphingobacterium anhuiense TaxID=493780 RepID=A0ABW5YUH4_9SPHI
MRKLFQNNLGLRSIVLYILICILVVAISVVFLQYHKLIIVNALDKASINGTYILYSLLVISSLTLVTTFFVSPIFFFEYLQKENVDYALVKLLPYLPMVSVFGVYFLLFRPGYNDFTSEDKWGLVDTVYVILSGVTVLIAGVIVLHFIKGFQSIFKNAMVFAYNKSYGKAGDQFRLDDFRKLPIKENEEPKYEENPNDELIKRVEKLISSTEELEVEPIGDVNFNIVIYVYGDGFDYCLLDSGLDIPFIFGDENPEIVLAECHFLHINIALYFRVDQVYIFNFEDNYVVLNPAIDRNLHNIRSKRVNEKLNSYRVKGKPSGYFHIHPSLGHELRAIVDGYANKRFNH